MSVPRLTAHASNGWSGRRSAAVAVFAAFLLLLMVWTLVGGGTTSSPMVESTGTAPEGDEATPSTDVADEEVEDLQTDLPLVTYEVHLARDPFDPVVPEPDPEPTAPDSDDPDAPQPDPDDPDAPPSDPSDPDAPPLDPGDPGPSQPGQPQPGEPAPGDPDTCFGDDEVVCNGHVVSLHEILLENGERVAIIQVDTTVYEVREGESFAQRFQLLAIGDNRVDALFGDVRFSLPIGERVLK